MNKRNWPPTWLLIFIFILSSCNSTGSSPETVEKKPAGPENFVQTVNGVFLVNQREFHFAGTNAYYLPNYEKLNTRVVDRALDAFEQANISVIRMWAFYDGFDCGYSQHDSSENVIQTAPGVYDERALQDLDRVIAKGKERGIRFILPLINFWDELGGICQYNTWAGASSPSQNMDFFLNNPDTQRWFRDYISMLLNRVNTVTGVAYKDEPAVFAWQIMNEARNPGQDPEILRDWYQEMARYIKSIAPNQMVSTGEEGFDDASLGQWRAGGKFDHPSYSSSEYANTYVLRANKGTSYVLNTAIPEIDFGSAHWYPTDWGWSNESRSEINRAMQAWLSDHHQIAQNQGKPLVLGEYGFTNSSWRPIKELYSPLWNHAEEIGIGGTLLWQFTLGNGPKCREFGGNICYPDDSSLYDEYVRHIRNMNQ
jgi:mannan endo-1,4-beta-mannosidase